MEVTVLSTVAKQAASTSEMGRRLAQGTGVRMVCVGKVHRVFPPREPARKRGESRGRRVRVARVPREGVGASSERCGGVGTACQCRLMIEVKAQGQI